MVERVRLSQNQQGLLAAAIQAFSSPQAALARQVGLSSPELSRLANQRRDSVRAAALRQLVAVLGLEYEAFFEQYEIELDDQRLREIEDGLTAQLRHLRSEVRRLHGTTFTAFVGFRVEGAVDKVYEGRITITPTGAAGPKASAA